MQSASTRLNFPDSEDPVHLNGSTRDRYDVYISCKLVRQMSHPLGHPCFIEASNSIWYPEADARASCRVPLRYNHVLTQLYRSCQPVNPTEHAPGGKVLSSCLAARAWLGGTCLATLTRL
ncbi:hypothetical protein RRG08_052192 [Elysia crispata]|uniref:Uncharacterized protein n=1 Tax=Elysia crispata TaxID=231223 RepID=A0AAE1D7F0_9GAST|nr:hypothetical protein RRG08_052192 [Elysia crispata]